MPEPLKVLIDSFKSLPGIGERSAYRLVFALLKDPNLLQQLINALSDAKDVLKFCSLCHGITDQDPCPICTDPERDKDSLCIVERPQDVFYLEEAGIYNGRYFVLGGVLSPVDGIGPEDLQISHLEERVEREKPKEVIIALSPTVEGDATSYFLRERLSRFGARITRIARGIPTGAELSLSDQITLREAFQGRSEL